MAAQAHLLSGLPRARLRVADHRVLQRRPRWSQRESDFMPKRRFPARGNISPFTLEERHTIQVSDTPGTVYGLLTREPSSGFYLDAAPIGQQGRVTLRALWTLSLCSVCTHCCCA